jgi:hypothetical protein
LACLLRTTSLLNCGLIVSVFKQLNCNLIKD